MSHGSPHWKWCRRKDPPLPTLHYVLCHIVHVFVERQARPSTASSFMRIVAQPVRWCRRYAARRREWEGAVRLAISCCDGFDVGGDGRVNAGARPLGCLWRLHGRPSTQPTERKRILEESQKGDPLSQSIIQSFFFLLSVRPLHDQGGVVFV